MQLSGKQTLIQFLARSRTASAYPGLGAEHVIVDLPIVLLVLGFHLGQLVEVGKAAVTLELPLLVGVAVRGVENEVFGLQGGAVGAEQLHFYISLTHADY